MLNLQNWLIFKPFHLLNTLKLTSQGKKKLRDILIATSEKESSLIFSKMVWTVKTFVRLNLLPPPLSPSTLRAGLLQSERIIPANGENFIF